MIKTCNNVLEVLDTLEEQRTLYIQEFNFRKILKEHVLNLLRYKREYWKKRYTIRWTKLGDEGTKFFHAAATERYRINTITSLVTEDNRTVSAHSEKAALLLDDFKKRMGYTSNPTMLYNLRQLVQPRDDLEHLSAPFSSSDVDKVIRQMPVDKAPRLDGFNSLFIKSCWEIIKEDVYTLFFDFFNGSLNLEAINNYFITLVPKVNNPTAVGDFRPISLLNCILKLITKTHG